MKQKITILGSTGSIGVNTLDVLARHIDKYQVFALTAATQVDLLFQQCVHFQPTFAVMVSDAHAKQLSEKIQAHHLPTQVLGGAAALEMVASHDDVQMVMAAIVGAAGLRSCMAAAHAGKKLLLANKEALVVGANVFMQAVQKGGATLLPIDSEHSAIFQSLPADPATWSDQVSQLILTASGGPFRQLDIEQLRHVTPEQACTHPNWTMGRKISVDSATMMNKALEVIEASYLFGFDAEKIDVVIHPQSIIHSMVQYRDASVIAQMGTPDMRGPIAYGLGWPARLESGAKTLNFANLPPMTFESMKEHQHSQRFPGLQLAWDALSAPLGTTAILNAANEVAVDAFLSHRIRFDQIHGVNHATLDAVLPSHPDTMDALLDIDSRARSYAQQVIQTLLATS